MKAFAVALLGLGFIPSAIAGPYVSTKTEFKGNEVDTQRWLTKQELAQPLK